MECRKIARERILLCFVISNLVFYLVLLLNQEIRTSLLSETFRYKGKIINLLLSNKNKSDGGETQETKDLHSNIKNLSLKIPSGYKIIVINTEWYGSPSWLPKERFLDTNFQTLDSLDFACPKKCLYTHNRSFISYADLVFSSIVDMKEPIQIPLKRPAHQVWAAFICESPVNVEVGDRLGKNNNRFNWSASYRLDSDVYWPSGHFYPRKRRLHPSKIKPTLVSVKNKTKLAAWIVSNCATKGKRELIVKHLQKTMQIDIFGQCGTFKCPPEGNCRQHISTQYKFYLSFENSLCMDYVTEKFYEAFANNMIPITYGLSDYTRVAPPHSYINILDYPSTADFVKYINFLDKNPEEYLKYFKWKRDYIVITHPTKAGLCNACVKLYEWEGQFKTLNFQNWWIHPPSNRPLIFKNLTFQDQVCLESENI